MSDIQAQLQANRELSDLLVAVLRHLPVESELTRSVDDYLNRLTMQRLELQQHSLPRVSVAA